MFFAENWISDVARRLGIPQHIVREKNFYRDSDCTHYGQELTADQVRQIKRSLGIFTFDQTHIYTDTLPPSTHTHTHTHTHTVLVMASIYYLRSNKHMHIPL